MAKRPAQPDAPDAKALDASCRIAVFFGEEAFLRQLYTAQLKDALAAAHGEVDLLTFDGASTPAADVLDECRSFGLIAAHKLVIVETADALVKEDNRPLFERYAEAPSEGATLVLRSSIWRAGKLDKLIERVGVIKKCEPLSHDRAVGWAVTRCKKRHECSIERDAAELLVERIGVGLARIDTEIAKLAAAAGGEPITAPLVAQFVGMSREEEVWGLQRVLLGGSPEQNLRHLREALDVSRHPTQLIIYSMTDLARKVHGAAQGLKQGANPYQIAGALKLWGSSKETILEAARQLGPARARRLFKACVETDARLKSGFGDPELALEQLALRFAGVGERR